MCDKKYTKAIRYLLRYIADKLPLKTIKDFERLGKHLSEIEKNRDLLKDLKTVNELKNLFEGIFKIRI